MKIKILFVFIILIFSAASYAEKTTKADMNELEKPLYTPFVERYVLDELKQLRIDMAAQKNQLLQQIFDREHSSVDRAVAYATDTVTYFFYLIAAATSVLVLVGWTSVRDIKERVHSVADDEINKLVFEYEQRLKTIEAQLNQKTKHIEQNREEIELTQDIQSLWLRAGQDINPHKKITIYDQILKLKPDDCEAYTYKADAALELNEPQWAVNLCRQALQIDPQNSHAFYQLACTYTIMGKLDEAIKNLSDALHISSGYHEKLMQDPALQALRGHPDFDRLLNTPGDH